MSVIPKTLKGMVLTTQKAESTIVSLIENSSYKRKTNFFREDIEKIDIILQVRKS